MFFRRLFAAALTMLVVTGCAPDTTAPGGDRPQAEAPGLPPLGSPEQGALITSIRTDLILLGQRVTPNDQSFLGKFDALVAALDAGTGFGDELEDLISKINLEVQKYTGPPINGKLTDCDDGTTAENCQTIEQLRVKIIQDLYRLVGLNPGGNICVLPGGHDGFTCETVGADGNAGFVYFPPGLFKQLTFISVKKVPEGVGSGLDEYGATIEVRTAPVSNFREQIEKPIVVTCVPANLPPALLERLLLGHRRADKPEYSGNPPFSLLPEAEPNSIWEKYAASFCDALPASSGPSVFGLASESRLNRMLVRAGELLLPERLFARTATVAMTRGFSGASGSPEEFSTFKAVDRGVTGAGGSPEEFAPQAADDMLPTANAVGTASTVPVGPGALTVTVTTVGIPPDEPPLPVAGVKVFFELVAPGGAVASLESNASFLGCDKAVDGVIEVETNPDGEAVLPCLNFGTLAGYKKLLVSFDPKSVDQELCMIASALGGCVANYSERYLIQTVAGPATQIFTYMPTATPVANALYDYGVGVEDTPVADAPQVLVLDAFDNPVGAGIPIFWLPLVSSNGAILVPGVGGATSASGLAQATSWTLGPGANSVIASLDAQVEESSPVATFTASTPSSGIAFSCQLGSSKTDLGRLQIPRSPNRTIRTITLYMSVTGQASSMNPYEANISVKRVNDEFEVGSGTGSIVLPGNNGTPTAVTFELTDTVLPGETGQGNSALWIDVAVTAPIQRKFQVWHNSGTFKNNDPCNNALVYAPGSTTSFKRGLSIIAAY